MQPAIDITQITEAINRVNLYFKTYYRKSLDELDISDVPGYWRDKEAKMHPGHSLHGCLGCEGPFKATYRYYDKNRDEKGRFASPYRTWRLLKQYASTDN